VGMQWGSLSVASAVKELLGRRSSGPGLEDREYDHGDPSHHSCVMEICFCYGSLGMSKLEKYCVLWKIF
jgi:hypothetical protein